MGTDGLTDRRTDELTDQPMDKVSYRGAFWHLKKQEPLISMLLSDDMVWAMVH
jgi:hypothetical protein